MGAGGDPVAAFHRAMAHAARHWPETMLTLSTHDTKRSGDVRARISVLSELPAAWERAVARWANHNRRHKHGRWPDRNAEYLLYQTLVGAWPIDPARAGAFMAKAAKEAKVHTSWTEPQPDYDEALAAFVTAVLADAGFIAELDRVPGRAPHHRGRPGQLAGADRAAADLPRRSRPVPGHRGVGPDAGRPGQPQAGRLHGAQPAARRPRQRGP